MNKLWFTYLIICENNTLYTGVTNDLNKRLQQHKGILNNGAKYTKSKKAIGFVYVEPHFNRSIAQKREYIIRNFSRKKKDLLIKESIFKGFL